MLFSTQTRPVHLSSSPNKQHSPSFGVQKISNPRGAILRVHLGPISAPFWPLLTHKYTHTNTHTTRHSISRPFSWPACVFSVCFPPVSGGAQFVPVGASWAAHWRQTLQTVCRPHTKLQLGCSGGRTPTPLDPLGKLVCRECAERPTGFRGQRSRKKLVSPARAEIELEKVNRTHFPVVKLSKASAGGQKQQRPAESVARASRRPADGAKWAPPRLLVCS